MPSCSVDRPHLAPEAATWHFVQAGNSQLFRNMSSVQYTVIVCVFGYKYQWVISIDPEDGYSAGMEQVSDYTVILKGKQ